MMNVMRPGNSLLPPPIGDWDREERRMLIFTVMMFDINASSSSSWPNMMMIDEMVSLGASVSLTLYSNCGMMDADGSIRNYHAQEPIGNYLYVLSHA